MKFPNISGIIICGTLWAATSDHHCSFSLQVETATQYYIILSQNNIGQSITLMKKFDGMRTNLKIYEHSDYIKIYEYSDHSLYIYINYVITQYINMPGIKEIKMI